MCHLLLTHNGGFQVDEDGARDMLARAGLAEEGVEGVVATSNGLVFSNGHLAIRLDAVLQAVELPARVTDLDTGLTHVDGDHLTLTLKVKNEKNDMIEICNNCKCGGAPPCPPPHTHTL